MICFLSISMCLFLQRFVHYRRKRNPSPNHNERPSGGEVRRWDAAIGPGVPVHWSTWGGLSRRVGTREGHGETREQNARVCVCSAARGQISKISLAARGLMLPPNSQLEEDRSRVAAPPGLKVRRMILLFKSISGNLRESSMFGNF